MIQNFEGQGKYAKLEDEEDEQIEFDMTEHYTKQNDKNNAAVKERRT